MRLRQNVYSSCLARQLDTNAAGSGMSVWQTSTSEPTSNNVPYPSNTKAFIRPSLFAPSYVSQLHLSEIALQAVGIMTSARAITTGLSSWRRASSHSPPVLLGLAPSP